MMIVIFYFETIFKKKSLNYILEKRNKTISRRELIFNAIFYPLKMKQK